MVYLSVNNPLRDPLPVEMCHFLQQDMVLKLYGVRSKRPELNGNTQENKYEYDPHSAGYPGLQHTYVE